MLGPEEHPGNWLQTSPGLAQLFIRQFFGNWDTEVPMRIRIERVGADDVPAPPSPAQIAAGLLDAAESLIEDSNRWAESDRLLSRPPERVRRRHAGVGGDGAAESLNRAFHFCFWRLEPDEALVIRVPTPRSRYWNMELGNYWMNSVDYRYRLSSLNQQQAVLEADGEMMAVVAHTDPGVSNWLDTGTHGEGLIVHRWVDADATPSPVASVVAMDALDDALGPDSRRIGARGATPSSYVAGRSEWTGGSRSSCD